jgi:acyl-coenzyme A thioesterase PaaI-like protein
MTEHPAGAPVENAMLAALSFDADATAEFASDPRRRLTGAVRHVIDAILTRDDVDDAVLADAADAADAIAAAIAGSPHAATERGRRRLEARSHGDYLTRSPIVGPVNPLAPPLSWTVVDGAVVGHGVFHAAYEGPPGYVHGGWIALTFDEILGMANVASANPGMTGSLKVRYRRPTPLHTDVEFRAWTEAVDGRRVTARGTMSVDGVVTAEAEGLFVIIDPEKAWEYFGRARGEAAPPGVAGPEGDPS